MIGPRGRLSVRLIGVTPGFVTLGGALTRNVSAGPSLIGEGVGLPSGVARAIGVRPEHTATLLAGGHAHLVKVRAVAGAETIGSVAESPLALALLGYAQAVGWQARASDAGLRRAAAGSRSRSG